MAANSPGVLNQRNKVNSIWKVGFWIILFNICLAGVAGRTCTYTSSSSSSDNEGDGSGETIEDEELMVTYVCPPGYACCHSDFSKCCPEPDPNQGISIYKLWYFWFCLCVMVVLVTAALGTYYRKRMFRNAVARPPVNNMRVRPPPRVNRLPYRGYPISPRPHPYPMSPNGYLNPNDLYYNTGHYPPYMVAALSPRPPSTLDGSEAAGRLSRIEAMHTKSLLKPVKPAYAMSVPMGGGASGERRQPQSEPTSGNDLTTPG